MTENPLSNYHILLADGDVRLGNILKGMLESMGFTQISFCASGDEALRFLKANPVDFVITELQLRDMGGMELLHRIRHSVGTPDPSLPIIVLSGRAEREDIVAARDAGMHEYVLKPFSAQTIFQRLERMIERPRNFVVSPGFVGPDRRFMSKPPEGVDERRGMRVPPQIRPDTPSGRLERDAPAQVWAADTSLRKKLGQSTSLSEIIPEEKLHKAQGAIDAVSSESLLWVQESMNELKHLYDVISKGEELYTMLPINLSETAMTVSTRAGTFGYHTAAKVAYMLHHFCFERLRMEEENHHLVIKKHLDALAVSLHDAIKKKEPTSANLSIIQDLRALTEKLAA